MLVSALLVRNEVGRELERVLTNARSFADLVLVLDDGSTDGSPALAKKMGAIVRHRKQPGGMWGNEAPARAELWDWAAEIAGPEGWVLVQDADQLLWGDPRPYCASEAVNTWAFPLYDLWDSETTYRDDGYWQAHLHPRPWLFCPSRVPPGWTPQWPERGIHPGHCPANWPMVAGIAPDLAWGHLAYLTSQRRRDKLTQYRKQFGQMTPFERAHAESIGE